MIEIPIGELGKEYTEYEYSQFKETLNEMCIALENATVHIGCSAINSEITNVCKGLREIEKLLTSDFACW